MVPNWVQMKPGRVTYYRQDKIWTGYVSGHNMDKNFNIEKTKYRQDNMDKKKYRHGNIDKKNIDK